MVVVEEKQKNMTETCSSLLITTFSGWNIALLFFWVKPSPRCVFNQPITISLPIRGHNMTHRWLIRRLFTSQTKQLGLIYLDKSFHCHMLIWEGKTMQWIQESYAKSNTKTLSDVTLGKKKKCLDKNKQVSHITTASSIFRIRIIRHLGNHTYSLQIRSTSLTVCKVWSLSQQVFIFP